MKLIYNKIATLILALCFALTLGAVPVGEVENVHVKDRTRYVTDMAGMLSPEATARVDAILGGTWQQSKAEPIVVIVDNLDDMDVDEYATELFDLWRPGKKDTDSGVILLISKDDRKFSIRTGYGVEGILPDALCWSIHEKIMAPYFREGNYDAGVIAGATAIHDALTSPEAREELMSKYANDAAASDDTVDNQKFFSIYISICVCLLIALFIYYIYLSLKVRKMPTAEAYHKFEQMKLAMLILSCISIGIVLPVYLQWIWKMKRIRNKQHICTNCGTRMKKLDEETDNLYLTPAQDTEEKMNSVDYDVWLCPNCNQTEVIPFINRSKDYEICPVCGARAMALVRNQVTRQPTQRCEGEGVKTYRCFNCGNQHDKRYKIPREESDSMVAPIIIGGLGGFGGGGGGGFSGGSFGGGMTGGGGSSGGW